MSTVQWQNMRWENIDGLPVPLVAHAAEDWIPVAAFERALELPNGRLVYAAKSPLNLGRVRLVSLAIQPNEWKLAVSRSTLMHLVHRLRPGTNNQMLRLVASADAISIGVSPDALIRRAREVHAEIELKAARRKAKADAITERTHTLVRLIQAFDDQHPIAKIEEEWVTLTGLQITTLHKAIRGSATSSSARKAYVQLAKDRGHVSVKVQGTGRVSTGRPPKLREETIRQIRQQAEDGAKPKDLARHFKTSPRVVQRIIESKYSSKAMKAILDHAPTLYKKA